MKKIKWTAVVVKPEGLGKAIAEGLELAKTGVMQLAFVEGQEAQAKRWLEANAGTLSIGL